MLLSERERDMPTDSRRETKKNRQRFEEANWGSLLGNIGVHY